MSTEKLTHREAGITIAGAGDPAQPGLAWPRYESTTRPSRTFDTETRVVNDPDRDVRAFWAAE